jgi:hypothetical protein
MFVAWQSRPLSERGFHRSGDWCKHPAGTPGRDVVLVPLVSVSERVDGKPRRRVAHRFGARVRPCCLTDTEAPQGRLAFWDAVERSWQRAPGDVLLEREALRGRPQITSGFVAPGDESLLWVTHGGRGRVPLLDVS